MTDAPTAETGAARNALDALVDRYHAGERLRVWSFVITVFGDAIVPRGGMVGMAALQEITDRMGISPGALRAALSRLAKDGWAERERHGRRSYYRLTPDSAALFAEAGRRFYAPGPPPWDGTWHVAVAPDEPAQAREQRAARLAGHGYAKLSNGLFVRPDTAAPRAPADLDDMFRIAGTAATLPGWVRTALSDPGVNVAYATLASSLSPLHDALSGGGSLRPLDAMLARALVIHDWRRIVLRDTDLPAALRPDGWAGEDARDLVKRLYACLLEPSERWLDRCDGRPGGTLPAPGSELRLRFR